MRVYNLPIAALSVDFATVGGIDICEIIAHTNRSLIILGAKLATTIAETALKQRFEWYTRTVVGTGGTAITLVDLQNSSLPPTAAFTAFKGRVPPATGTNTLIEPDADDTSVGYRYLPTPEERMEFPGGSRIVLHTPGEALAGTLVISGYVRVAEIG